jgi:HlyD family secretion protein
MNEKPDARMRARRRWWIGGAVVILALAAAAALRRPSGPPVPTARATHHDLTVTITSDGTLEPPSGGELRASEPAVVAAILAREGERVTRGTPLVRLSSSELEQSALTARSGALSVAEERARAAAELDAARREEQHRRGIAESDARLLDQKAISRAAAAADELALRQAQDRVRQAEARLASLSGRGRGRVELSAEAARELERRVAALTVRAPSDGVVYGLPRKIGETVAPGQIVASVADPQHLRARIRVDQPDLPRVQVGQRIVVTFDGLPDRRWSGRVLSVPAGVTEAAGRQVGEVIGEISDPERLLPPNAAVNVQIVTGEKPGALAIPRAALLRDGERRFVYVFDHGRARRRDVAVGLIGVSEVEITRGLAEGDVVLIPGTVPLSEGERVSVRRG